MSRHDETIRLRDMLDHASEAVDMARGHHRSDLDRDRQFRFALTHLVEIVGEAAAHISEPFRLAHPNIPWKTIVGVRNRLIHGYSQVDLGLLWDILTIDLPPLILSIQEVLGIKEN
jgi:uncharacterized protein with HEPN domain